MSLHRIKDFSFIFYIITHNLTFVNTFWQKILNIFYKSINRLFLAVRDADCKLGKLRVINGCGRI